MEMAFAGRTTSLAILEDVLPPIFAKYGKYNVASAAPFRRIGFTEAMETYGSDKPDLRIDLVVQDATAFNDCGFEPFAGNTVKAIVVSDCKLARKAIDKLLTEVEVQAGNKAYWVKVDEQGNLAGGIAKFLTERKDELVSALGLKPATSSASPPARRAPPEDRRRAAQQAGQRLRRPHGQGALRVLLDRGLPHVRDRRGVRRAGVLPQPLLHAQRRLEILEKAERGEIDPLSITAYQYDLVCNGVELSSGAVRNHDPEIMIKAFELVRLGEEDVKSKFPACTTPSATARRPMPASPPAWTAWSCCWPARSPSGNHPLPDEQERPGHHDGRSLHRGAEAAG